MKETRNMERIPVFRRARGYLLYDSSGNRYLDLYQDGGRAILGHRIPGMTGIIKSTASKGLTASYPSVYGRRLSAQLKLLFPEAGEIRFYRNIERALALLSDYTGENVRLEDFKDFPGTGCRFSIWRPFLEMPDSGFFIPLLPFPGAFGPAVVVSTGRAGGLAASDVISPLTASMMIKSCAALKNAQDQADDKAWEPFDSALWSRKGPYLRFGAAEDSHVRLFRAALENGVLLPPDPAVPGIIPLEYEPGQIRKFLDAVRRLYAG